jgi:hypothetical protein
MSWTVMLKKKMSWNVWVILMNTAAHSSTAHMPSVKLGCAVVPNHIPETITND